MRVSLPKRMALLPDRTLTKYRDAHLFTMELKEKHNGMVAPWATVRAKFYGIKGEYVACRVTLNQTDVMILGSGFAQVIGKGPYQEARALSLALRSCGILPSDDLDTSTLTGMRKAMHLLGEQMGCDPRTTSIHIEGTNSHE